MKWQVTDWLCESYRAQKENGLRAHIYKSALWAGVYLNHLNPGYDVRYKAVTIARIYFERKGATVRTLPAAAAFPEISDLDLVEIAMWVNKMRCAARHDN
jgi:hypothetical protein